jgi:HSP20 family protein
MALVRWNPARSLFLWNDERDPFLGLRPRRNEFATRGWYPTVDIVESEEDVLISAELPGLGRDDVKVEVKDDVLTLKGEKKRKDETKEDGYHRIERRYGSFYRSFVLPPSVEKDNVKAAFENGVLTIRLPKAEQARPREIPVDVG